MNKKSPSPHLSQISKELMGAYYWGVLVLLVALVPTVRAEVPLNLIPGAENEAMRPLTLSEALALATQNNRDLQAARERMRGAHADVEKALSALLPTLTLQGRLTINEPEVSLSIDQSGSVFSLAYQGAQIADLQQANGTAGMRGPASAALYNRYCTDPGQPGAVQQACRMLQGGNLSALDAAIGSANISAVIMPRAQLDGILAANMPLIAPPAYPALKGARMAEKAQQKQLEATAAQILATVASSFYAAAGTDELLGARMHGIEVAQKTLDAAKLRQSAGAGNKAEVARAELALIQTQRRLLAAVDSRASAYRMLATLIGIEAGPFKVVPQLEARTELADEEHLIEQALHQRPELQTARLQANALGQHVFASWLRWTPVLSLTGSIRLTNATAFANRIDSYAVGLQLDWLLFDGFNRDAQRHSLESQQRELLLRIGQMQASIKDEVVNGRRAVMVKREDLVAVERSVQIAQETLELMRRQYQLGIASQLDLLTAQDSLNSAEVELAQARFGMALATLNIRRLIGEPLISAP